MALSKTKIENRLAPYLQINLDSKVLDLLVADDFVDIFNDVAHDLNEAADLLVERFKQEASTTTAEEATLTNYLLAGNILKILDLKFVDDNWATQAYGYNNDRIFFKDTIGSGTVIDIHYTRRCENVLVGTDEIDLPIQVESVYMDLLKKRILIDYGPETQGSYEEALSFYGVKAREKTQNFALADQGVFRSWMHQVGDDHVYRITKQWLGLENWSADVNGDYSYTGDD